MKWQLFILTLVIFSGCNLRQEAPVPTLAWELFDSQTIHADGPSMRTMEGVYSLGSGKETFGDQAVLKWSYVIEDNHDTTHYLSAFFNKEVSYLILEGRKTGDSLVLKGYWRKNVNTDGGAVRFIHRNGDANLTGTFGNGGSVPGEPLSLTLVRPLAADQGFQVVAHRGGGRNSDLLPASENSIGMIKLASQFGATGIEIDVRLTSDGVPIIYHDETVNERATKKSGLVGRIEHYSYAQLSTFVVLPDGQQIPTLREVLETVVYKTPLRFVWLDTKFEGSLTEVQAIREEYLQKATIAGRTLEILIGIPSEDAQKMLENLPDYTNIPSVCELDVSVVRHLNSKAWGPRWTLGLQNDLVDQMHAEGRKAFTWTLDVPEYIKIYIEQGKFDGLLTNYPSLVAHYHYVNEK